MEKVEEAFIVSVRLMDCTNTLLPVIAVVVIVQMPSAGEKPQAAI